MNCEACGLDRKCQSPRLSGEGTQSPSVLFVGIYPGAEEDAQGRVFVGGSGKDLRYIISQTSFADSYYLDNLVCCRPTNEFGQNREPSREEIQHCLPHLLRKIKELQPKVIVCLGELPTKILLQDKLGASRCKVSKLRGVPTEIGNKHYAIVTYHPAYFLRNEKVSAAEIYGSDFELIEKILAGTYGSIKVNHRLLKTQKEVWEFVSYAKDFLCIAYDIETNNNSEDPDRCTIYKPEVKVITCSFSVKHGEAFCIPIDHPQSLIKWEKAWFIQLIKSLFMGKLRIAHNHIFEYIAFQLFWGVNVAQDFRGINTEKNLLRDSLLSHYLMYPEARHALNMLIAQYLPEYAEMQRPFFEALDSLRKENRSYDNVDLELLAAYNNIHADSTMYFYEKFDPKEFDKPYQDMLLPSIEVMGDMAIRGIPFSVEDANKLIPVFGKKVSILTDAIQRHTDTRKVCQFLQIQPTDFNINSTPHIRELLVNWKGLKPLEYSKKTEKPSVDKDFLRYHRKASPLVVAIEETKRLQGLRSKFLVPFVEKWEIEGRVHPGINLHGTVPGRSSSSSPNMFNVKKDEELLKLFRAPEGNLIMVGDASQLELRMLANFSGDKAMLQVFEEDQDIHFETQKAVLHNDNRDDEIARVKAKGVNFGVIYGISSRGLILNLKPLGIEMSEYEAQIIIDNWKKKFPGAFRWLVSNWSFARKHGYLIGAHGWRWKITPDPGGYVDEEARKAFNYPIQGPAAFLNRMALLSLKDYKLARPILEQYDGNFFEIREENLMEAAKHIKYAMEHPDVPFKLRVPLKAEIKAGKSWGELKKVEL